TIKDASYPAPAGAGLRGVHHSGTGPLTWSAGTGPAGRATWQYGEPVRQGAPHVIWRRIGTHSILSGP
ncbi:hypothetical protein ACWD6I_26935, partial [Streptomyces sp. NPDC002454]